MAIFTVTPSSSTEVESSTISAGYKNLEITNISEIVNGVATYSGFNLAASNFTIGGDVVISNPNGIRTIVEGGGEGDQWHASSGIIKVELTDTVAPDDPSNKIKARCYYSQFTMPATNKFLDIDFDAIVSTNTHGKRPVGIRTHLAENSSDNVVITRSNGSGITRTTRTDEQDVGHLMHLFTGLVDDGVTSLVCTTTITAGGGYYLANQSRLLKGSKPYYRLVDVAGSTVVGSSQSLNGPWKEFLSWVVTDTKNEEGQTTVSKVELFYTPPQKENLNPDPYPQTNDFADWMQQVYIEYEARAISSEKTNAQITAAITNVSVDKITGGTGAEIRLVNITASKIGRVDLKVVEINGSNVAQKYYNFASEASAAFQSSSASLTVNMTQLTEVIPIFIPAVSADKIYSILLTETTASSPVVNLDVPGNTAGVPDALGEMKFYQYIDIASAKTVVTANTITNVTKGGTDISFPIYQANTVVPRGIQKTVTFTHTRTEGKTLTLVRQPYITNDLSNTTGTTNNDFRGFEQYACLGTNASSGATSIIISSLDNAIGLKVGMSVEDLHFKVGLLQKDGTAAVQSDSAGTQITSARVPAGCKITGLSSRTITISPALTGAIIANDKLSFKTSYKYDIDEAIATGNGSTASNHTVITTVAKITINKYGEQTPDGIITLQPNYITSS